jgi:hypothetical protein
MELTAIVIGGGMGGLATAQVLSKHFTSFVLIEKDQPQSLQGLSAVETWRMGVKARPGVSQVSCMHTCNTKLPRDTGVACALCNSVHPCIATNCAAVMVCFAVQSNPCSDSQGGLVWPMHAAGIVSVTHMMYGNHRLA